MKLFCTLPALILTLGAQPLYGAAAVPERRSPDRYEKVAAESAFAVATPTAPVSEPVKGWASNLYLAALGKSYVNGKEEVYAGIRSRTESASFSLFGNDPGFDDISIAGVEWADNLKSKVTLKKGSEFASIIFDPQLSQAPINPAVQNGRPPENGNGTNRPGAKLAPGRSLIRPPAPSTVPRPQSIVPLPQAAPAQRPQTGNSNTAVPDAPPRVRVIKSP